MATTDQDSRSFADQARAQVQQLVAAHTWGRQWGFLGQLRTNVVTLNLALDTLSK